MILELLLIGVALALAAGWFREWMERLFWEDLFWGEDAEGSDALDPVPEPCLHRWSPYVSNGSRICNWCCEVELIAPADTVTADPSHHDD